MIKWPKDYDYESKLDQFVKTDYEKYAWSKEEMQAKTKYWKNVIVSEFIQNAMKDKR